MTIWWLYLVLALIIFGGVAFIWLVITLAKIKSSALKMSPKQNLAYLADNDIDHIFTNEFKEELKNRGRIHFQNIINQNAEFLQQDLRLTSADLNDYMKKELTTKVNEELTKYEQSINDAKNLAIDSIKKTSLALEEQRQVLGQQVAQEIAAEKARILENFDKQLSMVVSHYVINAIGQEINLNDQLDFILANLESNKKAIIEDIKSVG